MKKYYFPEISKPIAILIFIISFINEPTISQSYNNHDYTLKSIINEFLESKDQENLDDVTRKLNLLIDEITHDQERDGNDFETRNELIKIQADATSLVEFIQMLTNNNEINEATMNRAKGLLGSLIEGFSWQWDLPTYKMTLIGQQFFIVKNTTPKMITVSYVFTGQILYDGKFITSEAGNGNFGLGTKNFQSFTCGCYRNQKNVKLKKLDYK